VRRQIVPTAADRQKLLPPKVWDKGTWDITHVLYLSAADEQEGYDILPFTVTTSTSRADAYRHDSGDIQVPTTYRPESDGRQPGRHMFKTTVRRASPADDDDDDDDEAISTHSTNYVIPAGRASRIYSQSCSPLDLGGARHLAR